MTGAGSSSSEVGANDAGGGWPPDPRVVAAALAGAVAVLGLAVLAGWMLALPLLTSWLPGLVQTKINAAVCLVLLGLATWLATVPSRREYRLLQLGLVALALAIAAATLFEHVTGVDLRIDQAFAPDTASSASPHPGRFAIQTGVAFICAGLAILTMGRRIRGLYVSEVLALACGTIGGVSLLGYLYGAPELLSLGSATQISLPASFALVAIAAALIAVDPNHSLVRPTRDPGIAGQVLRRMLPAAVLVVPAGAWLRLMGERAGLYDESVGLSIMVAFEALVLVAVGAWTTASVHHLEGERLQAIADLVRLGSAASTPLIETAPVGLAVLDRDLRYLYINPALAAFGGVPAVASLGQRIDRVTPAFADRTLALLAGVVADGARIHDLEVSGPARSDDRFRTWLLNAEPLGDAEGERVGIAISVVDITERKNREEAKAALAKLQRQAQAIGESIPFGIWVAEPDGRVSHLSESYLALTGQTMDQARGFGWMTALAPDVADEIRSDWAATIAAKAPWNRELVVRDAADRRHTVLSRGFPVRDESGEVTSWAGINLDITDRKEAEEFREAFLGILSHELGTPITSIYAASTLLSRPGLDEAARVELIGDITHETERLRRLVEDLVVLARVERGTIQVPTEPVSLDHLLRRVCDRERKRWPNCHLGLTVAPRLPVARAEEAFVEQIVRNLVENAVKYGPRDGPIELVADAPDGRPRVRVLDRGPGIDPAEADRLFAVFYRSERTSRVAGSGIGLFVAHRLVESIGGTIWGRPRDDGPGAEFGFQLQPATDDVA